VHSARRNRLVPRRHEAALQCRLSTHASTSNSDTASSCVDVPGPADRAECNRQLTEIKAVVTDCTAALEYAPRNLKAFLRRGLALEFLEKYDAAALDFKSAMGIDPSGGVASEGLRRVTAFRDLAASLAD